MEVKNSYEFLFHEERSSKQVKWKMILMELQKTLSGVC